MQLVHLICGYIIASLASCLAIDFCRIEACGSARHLGCNNSLTFHNSCLRHRRLVNMQYFREYLIKMHNKYRQDVASGAVQGLPPAQHMPEFLWDPYMAVIAEYHVKRCLKNLPSLCVATTRFPHPVHNYAVDWQPRQFKETSNVQQMTFLTEKWLHLVYSIQPNDPNSAPPEIRRIINDYGTHMGCAAAQDYDLRYSRFVLICYYSAGPFWDRQLYGRGAFNATKCPSGKSLNYANLCQTKPVND